VLVAGTYWMSISRITVIRAKLDGHQYLEHDYDWVLDYPHGLLGRACSHKSDGRGLDVPGQVGSGRDVLQVNVVVTAGANPATTGHGVTVVCLQYRGGAAVTLLTMAPTATAPQANNNFGEL